MSHHQSLNSRDLSSDRRTFPSIRLERLERYVQEVSCHVRLKSLPGSEKGVEGLRGLERDWETGTQVWSMDSLSD